MFKIGDLVFHPKTRYFGKVIGYGHQLFNDVYTTTLKVLVAKVDDRHKKELVVEDLYSMWTKLPDAAKQYHE